MIEYYYDLNEMKKNINNLPYYIYSKNDKYLKISMNSKSSWNIFDLLNITYKIYNQDFYIYTNFNNLSIKSKFIIKSINGLSPWDALVENTDTYRIVFSNNNYCNEKIIKKPLLVDRKLNNYTIYNNNNLFIKLIDINNYLDINLAEYPKIDTCIIDLRDNPGGNVLNAIKFLENFFDYNETIVYLNSPSHLYEIKSKVDNKIKYNKIIVLINRKTHSSSEMIASVLITKKKAISLGENSGGKRVVTNREQIGSYFLDIPCFIHSPIYSSFSETASIVPNYMLKDNIIDEYINFKVKAEYNNYERSIEKE